ncbi:MAG TPA: Fur family transcriptional regulator [Thermoleophilaceae bacterium]|jgi:Fur family ferric uptake transcriptional regulator
MKAAVSEWQDHAQGVLSRAGYRASAPRAAVVGALSELGCSVTAKEIADLLDEQGQSVGLASIYRALDLLDRMRLVNRFEVGEGVARYEPAHPGGEHHHHLVCQSCGNVSAFEDPGLERAIEKLSRRVDYAIDAHDVTLRGECPACHARA